MGTVCVCITILRKVVRDILLDKVIFEQRPKGVEISYVSIWKNTPERGNRSVQRPQNHVIAIRCPINSLDVNRSSSKCFPVFLWFPLREGLTGIRRGIFPVSLQMSSQLSSQELCNESALAFALAFTPSAVEEPGDLCSVGHS